VVSKELHSGTRGRKGREKIKKERANGKRALDNPSSEQRAIFSRRSPAGSGKGTAERLLLDGGRRKAEKKRLAALPRPRS